jgi:hypothetical protein
MISSKAPILVVGVKKTRTRTRNVILLIYYNDDRDAKHVRIIVRNRNDKRYAPLRNLTIWILYIYYEIDYY